MHHIFISYSRKDLDLAQEIVDALSQEQLEIWIDWKSIPKGEDWEQEIYLGIEGADAFLFLISPDSVKSEMCNNEILHAIRNNKRILPILIRDTKMGEFLEATAREEIHRLNWIFCRKDRDDFTRAMQNIQETIRIDYEWLKFHTVLQTKALAWDRARREGSRLLRGKELKETEARINSVAPGVEPCLTELQQQFISTSKRSVRRRQALPYQALLVLASVVFLGGKFYYQVLPVPRACPALPQVTIHIQSTDLPATLQARLLAASEKSVTITRLRSCKSERVERMDVTVQGIHDGGSLQLQIVLPMTPAYRLDFLQEIRRMGPEVMPPEEAMALIEASAAYSIGEYRTAINLLRGHESLSALTLLAQAQLFSDNLEGSRAAYELALHKPQPDEAYSGTLNMGAALAWWRPESYFLLSARGNTEDCKQAARYYAQARDWIQTNKLAQNIRYAYDRFCINANDPAYSAYLEWRNQPLQEEPDPGQKDATQINAVRQYMLALDQEVKNENDGTLYKERLISARSLLLARAALSEFYWGAEDNCLAARTWRDDYRSGIISNIERRKLRSLLQAQPLFCR
jgi:hypothetical protein